MKSIRRGLQAFLILAIGLACIAFILENNQTTSLVFIGWTTPQLPLAVYMVVVFLSGMVVGPLLFWRRIWRYRSSKQINESRY